MSTRINGSGRKDVIVDILDGSNKIVIKFSSCPGLALQRHLETTIFQDCSVRAT